MDNKEGVKRLLLLLGKYKKTIVVIVGCLLVSTGLNLCVPLISRRIMDDGFIGGNKKLLIELVLVSMVIYAINSLVDLIKEKKRVDISAKIQYFLSEQSFTHLMKLWVNYFNNTNYAETLNNINTDINQMTSVADSSVFFVITQAFSMTGGIIGLFIIDFRMTILVLLFIPFKCAVMKYFAKKQKRIMDEFIKKNQKYAKWFGDTVGGVREVKLFNILDRKHEEFDQNQKDIIEKQKQMNMLGQWNTITDSLMVQFLSTLLYILGANLVFDLQLSVGSVFAFITYSSYVTGPISAILNIGYLLSGIIPSTKRYYAFMDLEEETDNGETADLCPDDLKLEQVSFAYEKLAYEKEKYVLKDVDILFAKGSKTAIIGRNGSGKTTIINLLTRMYEPISGKILLGAEKISELSLSAYRNIISVVSQQIYLFNDTIRNNICLYKQVDEARIEAACKDSGLEDFIKEVSLDYVVGQNGAMLSGGQKQKIALARALIHDKPIIIFDEATSNTDAYSEQQINKLLNTKLKEKTVIVITHKKEILNKVDQIVVLKKGVVVDIGAYDELIGKSDELNIMMENAD
ncbi:ABC transporter ATP-binding protein [Roseburia sp. TF10-5]|jgi:ATP-binding cassette subfamily B protein|uniref:ABC transporter ATP-binding protein n=1 Tax=Roseburia sp. TF10-5 TaxID=2293144 RepID=UPI000E491695|nr:ABC transporter ATP-binding protein [Roseburia sp. TF10-5]RGI14720.1 ABC transporter ATP-binding protein [Roseburia sp. TF10-5]